MFNMIITVCSQRDLQFGLRFKEFLKDDFQIIVSVWRSFLFLWVLGMGYVISLWHSLSLPYNHFAENHPTKSCPAGLLDNMVLDLF